VAGPIWVIQEHAATAHHFDWRLEVDGVLVSWAVPKGPSTDPRVKRLAVPVDDHAMSHADFEGTTGETRSGPGRVIVWDRGTYEVLSQESGRPVDMRAALDRGHVSVWLEGHKLQGGWAFIRTGRDWIVVKRRDRYADAGREPTLTERESVLSGRTLDEVV